MKKTKKKSSIAANEFCSKNCVKNPLTLFFLCAIIILIDDDILIDKLEFQFKRVHNLNISTALFTNQCTNHCKSRKKK